MEIVGVVARQQVLVGTGVDISVFYIWIICIVHVSRVKHKAQCQEIWIDTAKEMCLDTSLREQLKELVQLNRMRQKEQTISNQRPIGPVSFPLSAYSTQRRLWL